ncbi:MAG: 50S ribosomal protein L7ae [Lachnospira sp.]|nr:50S ribosomal protein L7ae [Lachnospira sp.]
MNQDKTLSMLGLAQKAGKVASGEFSTEKAIKSGKASIVIVADDSSDNTKKMFKKMCDYYKVPVYYYSDKETLGHAIGKQFRASLAVIDEGFGKQIQKHIGIGLE